jgi:hypothetical protein
MKTLYPGSIGPEVKLWQLFLRGLFEESEIIINGKFDEFTVESTKDFQNSRNLSADGVVGPKTLSEALKLGFDVMKDESEGQSGPNWPLRPQDAPLNSLTRAKLFGRFSFVPNPTKGNPEGIRLTDSWAADNITTVNIPCLSGLPGSNKDGTVLVHRAIARQFEKLFVDWSEAGLNKKILTWGGVWVPRFVRGSRTSLSNHSWGTAFDINAQWNGLGVRPALMEEKGSVRELVEIAFANGFYWGGWFKSRPDGMHFEAYKIVE